MRRLYLPLLALFAATPAWPALTWENTTVDVEATPEQEQAVGVFRFQNTGSRSVTITETHASCGCTAPALDKKTYAPGESGELRAVYTFGDATGRQQKTVTVVTDDPEQSTVVLTLRVAIPEFFQIQPRFVMWRRDEEPTPKAITIHAQFPDVARPVAVETRDPRFTAELVTNDEHPGDYVISITPRDTSAQMFTSVIVTTSAPAGRSQTISLFATVR